MAFPRDRTTRGPSHVELDLTDRCNVACYFCNQQDVRTKEQISLPHLVRLVDELAEGGLRSIRMSGGGDPLFHHAILEFLDHVHALNAWYAHDETLTLTPQYISSLLAHAGDPRSPYWDLMRDETLPAESLLASRMQAMTLAGVGQLSATANWHRIMSEWICGSPPSSPLGTAEAEFFAARLGYSRRQRDPGSQRQHPHSAQAH
jgi:hypothetical protein